MSEAPLTQQDEFDVFDELFVQLNTAIQKKLNQIPDPDQKDELDELFLQINNGLSDKKQELKELQQLNEKKTVQVWKKVLELKKREEVLMKREENFHKMLIQPVIPDIMLQIPDYDPRNLSLPFAKALGNGTIYNSVGPTFKNIDAVLRVIFSNTQDPQTKITIASAYYLVTFPSADPHAVLKTANLFYSTLKTLHHEVLDNSLEVFNKRVIKKLEEQLAPEI